MFLSVCLALATFAISTIQPLLHMPKPQLQLFTLTCNDYQENTHIVYSTTSHEAVIVDLGCQYEQEWTHLRELLQEANLTVKLLLFTHAHPDHLTGLAKALEIWNVPYALHPDDLPLMHFLYKTGNVLGQQPDKVKDPDILLDPATPVASPIGPITVLHTPGHTPGGCCFYLPEEGIIFTGDTLFQGSIGRADLPGGNYQQLIQTINQHLLPLPDATTVYPGHGPCTTIGQEKKSNPFLQ
jgi:metallo-beta-lactamase family protein